MSVRVWLCALVVGASAALAYAPLFSFVCLCLVALVLPAPAARLLFICSACMLFVLLNLSKEIEGDLVTYMGLQHFVAGQPFSTLLRTDELRHVSGTYRISELGFYGTLWALVGVFGDNAAILPIAGTLGIYLPIAWGVLIWGRREGWNQRLLLVVLVLFFFGALNFVQTTHLLRQYVAGSLAFLAMALYADRQRLMAACAAVAACSMHNSSFLVIASVGLGYALFHGGLRWRSGRLKAVARILLLLFVTGGLMIWLGLRDIGGLGKAEGNLSVWHLLFAVSLLACHLYASKLRHAQSDAGRLLVFAFATVLAVSCGYFVVGLNLLALRYFAYLEWLYALVVAGILCAIPRRFFSVYMLSRLSAGAAAVFVLILRVNAAGWSYGPGKADMFIASAATVAGYVSR